MSVNRRDAEYAFFATRSGSTSKRLHDHMRAYYVSQVGGASANVKSLMDLQKQWLRKVITTAGGTPNSQYRSALWAQACAVKNFRVSKYLLDNQLTYYISITSTNGL